jgi:threonine/homoserine/homoserine lactone efflux protein
MLSFFLKGFALGLSIAAPVGPIGVLCIRRSLAYGMLAGFTTGLGAATADAAYGCVAAFGLTAISSFLVGGRLWIGLLGGVFLCYLGIRTLLSKPARDAQQELPPLGLVAGYGSTVLLTLSNPMTILSFIAVFAGFGLAASPDYSTASALVAGVFAGSGFWWLLLSTASAAFRSRLTGPGMRWINYLSGAVIFGFGIYVLASLTLSTKLGRDVL